MKQVLSKTSIFIIILFFISLVLFEFVPAYSSTSKSAEIVIEQSSGRILHEYNADTRMPMASTTKIMTALAVLENSDPDDLVIIPKEAQGIEGSSIYLKAGDCYTVKDLLYGLMLRSGNDSAVALAIHVAGSINAFSDIMNAKALELGAKNTNFTNPHGLHDDNHYTTARDLALITAKAYNNKLFRKIASSKSYKLKDNYIYNKNKLLSSYEGADGVKTGYTTVSGRCLVSSSTRNKMQVICVVLNCYDMWERSKALMDKAHNEFTMTKVLDSTDIYEIKLNNSNSTIKASAKTDKFYPLRANENKLLSSKINAIELCSPINAGESCGNKEVYLDNHLIFRENIYTIESIKNNHTRSLN